MQKFPNADIRAAIVWIQMLADDSATAAQKTALTVNDLRVRHFYDPNKFSGKAIAKTLGWAGNIAWDIYLFYAAGVQWIETPPIPTSWMHQLKDRWADREHFRTGDDLVRELFLTMKKLCDQQSI